MSASIRAHVFIEKNGLTIDTLRDVYGMTEVSDHSPVGLVSGKLSQSSIDSLRALRVLVAIDYYQAAKPPDNAIVRTFKLARSWCRVMLDDFDDGCR